MIHYPVTQAYIFLSLFLSGMLGAVLYRLFTYCGKVFSHAIFTAIFDFIFVASIAVLLFFALQIVANGNLRFYQIVAFIIGFWFFNSLYLQIVKKAIIKTAEVFDRLLIKLSSIRFFKKLFK